MASAQTFPAGLAPARLRGRAACVALGLAAAAALVTVAPGLQEVRAGLAGAAPGWLAIAVLLELLAGSSYVAMLRPVFCPRMSRWAAWRLRWSELAAGSLLPASGASGLALEAWVQRRAGMPAEQIARRSVAFFVIKSSVNFVAVAVLGALLAVGLLGPDLPVALTAVSAALFILAVAVAVAVALAVAVARLGPGAEPTPQTGRVSRWWSPVRQALTFGSAKAVLYAAYAAVGEAPALSVVLLGYLVGRLGRLLPIPGGVGGVDGGLIGALVLLGAPVGATVAAVLAYRVALFWLPLVVGGRRSRRCGAAQPAA